MGSVPTMAPVADQIFNVNGLVAVVTGGGSGIGAMMVKALALNGAAKVYILGRRREKLDETIKAIGKVCSFQPHHPLSSMKNLTEKRP
jgi:NADP-dependent 3-hydroxy acid dehydrogenase YdfG